MNKSDDSFYTLQNAPLDEAIFGKNLISLGGTDAIDNMFSDINIFIEPFGNDIASTL